MRRVLKTREESVARLEVITDGSGQVCLETLSQGLKYNPASHYGLVEEAFRLSRASIKGRKSQRYSTVISGYSKPTIQRDTIQ
jgi:hypothetical protein